MKLPTNPATNANNGVAARTIASAIRKALERGASVDIDGLGIFRRQPNGTYQFLSTTLPRVFIAYAREDAAVADRLYDRLESCGFNPWLDRRKLLPGQNWPQSIRNAIQTSDFAIVCFSHVSVRKKGTFQAEIRYALECARQLPLDDLFLVPVRIDDCRLPATIQSELHYVDLFPDPEAGFRGLVGVLRKTIEQRKAA